MKGSPGTTATPLVSLALALALALAVVLPAVPAAAQIWRGQCRLSGVVRDENDQPLAGAKITLTVPDEADKGPESVVTNRKGRWAVSGLAEGKWRLTVTAEGYTLSDGVIEAIPGPGKLTQVALRPLSQVTPTMAENSGSVILWLEKGNSLLDQQRYAEAREEYERALIALDRDQQPEVLRAIARTYFMENNVEQAAITLKQALMIAPHDDLTRQVYLGLETSQDHPEEGKSFLARLDAGGPEAVAAEVEAITGPTGFTLAERLVDDAPVEPPVPGRPGAYRTTFTERSPLSRLEVFLERYGFNGDEVRQIDPQAAAYDLANESFEVYVPEGYDGTTPWGLFVWVSPTPSGKVTRPATLEALARHHLIWVGANSSGNPRKMWDRIGLALDAAFNLKKLYAIDERRIYSGGYSGGGRTATGLAVLYPETFQGGLFAFGCDYYKKVPLPDKPGASWPAAFPPPPRAAMNLVRERSRYVFLTGENDFNRSQTRIYHRLYEKDGFEHLTYLEIPGADHYSGIPGEFFERAFEALDTSLPGAAPP